MARPLDGVRVLDLTVAWAGPLATRLLGDLGADVIKVEHLLARGAGIPDSPEVRRMVADWKWGQLPPPLLRSGMFPNADPGSESWNRSGIFNKMNRNKRSVTLNLKTEEGVDLFKRLIAISDAVVDNYAPDVMPKLGLDYPELARVNPRIIAVSLTGFGRDGPYAHYVSWGPLLEAMSGLDSMTGYEGEGPMKLGVAYPDAIGGLHGCLAVLLGLQLRARTGRGTFVDLSQLEAMTSLVGEAIAESQLRGAPAAPQGNRHAIYAPQGIYPCAGVDEWIALTIKSDEMWKDFCAAAGLDEIGAKYPTLLARRRWHDEIDVAISLWTGQRSKFEAMELLQERGVCAGAVLTNRELVSDRHLEARGFFVEIDNPAVGKHRFPTVPFRFGATPLETWRACPSLGEHNREILGGLLGLDAEEIASFEAREIIGTRPPGM
jgi:crotonobetainyl-CoA:carnitine CoA-transferase CaiB-like acyl-CoA transferase